MPICCSTAKLIEEMINIIIHSTHKIRFAPNPMDTKILGAVQVHVWIGERKVGDSKKTVIIYFERNQSKVATKPVVALHHISNHLQG